MDLEKRLGEDLRRGVDIPLERALLIISGLKTKEEVTKYTTKLDIIQEQFKQFLKSQNNKTEPKGKLLNDFFWTTKNERYNANFLLTDVIDAQLHHDKNKRVGCCLGLTLLYTVLGLREGLTISVIGTDDHILTKLIENNRSYRIEHTIPNAFSEFSLKPREQEIPVSQLINETYHRIGSRLKEQKYLEGAKETYNKSLVIEPNNPKVLCNLAYVNYLLDENDAAMEAVNRAIQIEQNFVIAYLLRGVIRQKLGELTGKIEDHDKAFKLEPNKNIYYEHLGEVYYQLQDFNAASEAYNQAIKSGEKDAIVYGRLGLIAFKLGKYKDATEYFKSATKLDPNDANLYINISASLLESGKPRRSIRHAKKALKLSPHNAKAHYKLGLAFEKLGKTKKASWHYRKAIEYDPKLEAANNRLSQLRSDLETIEDAIERLNSAPEIKSISELYCLYGDTKAESGNLLDAIICYEQAIKHDPHYLEAYNSLAVTYAELGKNEKAIGYFKRLLKNAPDNASSILISNTIKELWNLDLAA